MLIARFGKLALRGCAQLGRAGAVAAAAAARHRSRSGIFALGGSDGSDGSGSGGGSGSCSGGGGNGGGSNGRVTAVETRARRLPVPRHMRTMSEEAHAAATLARAAREVSAARHRLNQAHTHIPFLPPKLSICALQGFGQLPPAVL